MLDPDKELEEKLDELVPDEATPPSEEAEQGDNQDESEEASQTQETEEGSDEARPQGDEQFEIEGIKGRKFSVASLKQAHSHAYRHISKLEGELASMRKSFGSFAELKELCDADPKFRDHLLNAAESYSKLRDQGVSGARAAKATGIDKLPPEIRKELDDLKNWKGQQERQAEDAALDREMNELSTKYKLDDVARDNVLRLMLDEEMQGRRISAEKAFRYLQLEAGSTQEGEASRELARVRAAAHVGPSAASGGIRTRPTPPGNLSPEQQNAWLNKWADSVGLQQD